MGIAEGKISVVRRGVDASVFFPASRSEARSSLHLRKQVPIALWVGRMVPVKGISVLLDAAAILVARKQSFELYLIGSGELLPSIQAWIVQKNLAGHVHIVGAVNSSAALASWYRSADCTVLTSVSEGIPNVLLESKACGTPFVASAVGGIPEIAEAGVDRLVRSGDAAAFADALADAFTKSQSNATESVAVRSGRDAAAELVEVIRASASLG